MTSSPSWSQRPSPSPPAGPRYAICPACKSRLAPQRATCPACKTREIPAFMRGLWLVPLTTAVIAAPVGALFYLRCFGQSDRHMVVGISGLILAAVSAPFAAALRKGSTAAWYAWTMVLGAIMAGAAMFVMFLLDDSDKANPSLAYVYLAVTVVYAGWMWRTTSQELWGAVTTGYVLATIALSAWIIAIHAGGETFVLVIGMCAILIACSVLLSLTYAVPVRWWHGVGLGWTGDKIGRR